MISIRNLKTLPFCKSYWLLPALYAAFGAGQMAWAGHDCKYIDSAFAVETPQYLPASADVPERLKIKLRVWYSRTCNGGCAPANPKVRLELLDCDGNIIQSKTKSFSPPCPPASVNSLWTSTFDLCGKKIPTSFRIQEHEGCATEGCSDQSGWQPPGQPILLPELSFECPAEGANLQGFVNDLQCYGCGGVDPIPDSVLSFFKRKRNGSNTLYTLPAKYEGEANFGEVVNGSFVAPQDGLLVVRVVGANDIVDMYGSDFPNGPGWHLPGQPPDERSGVKVDPIKCLDLSSGQTYQFNIRAGKGKPPPLVKVYFKWFRIDQGNCCLQEKSRLIQILVSEMTLDSVDSLRPERARVPRSGGIETELRIPDCGKLDKAGFLTKWFVMWPTIEGLVIPEGHSKGWKIVGDTLISPAGEKYDFSE